MQLCLGWIVIYIHIKLRRHTVPFSSSPITTGTLNVFRRTILVVKRLSLTDFAYFL
jgi:hypothetical protein